MNEKQIFVIITSQSANLCSALENIKNGRLENAIATLEQSLDRYVVCLGSMRGGMQKTEDVLLVDMLKAIRSYRQRHPLQSSRKIVGPAGAEEHMTAQRILQEL